MDYQEYCPLDEFHKKHLFPEGVAVVNKWPHVYKNLSKKVSECLPLAFINPEDFCNLRYGFEFPRHWIGLADKFGQFATMLVSHLRSTGIQSDAYITSFIFKEKFNILTWQGDDNLIEPYKSIMREYLDCLAAESVELTMHSGDEPTLFVL